MITFGNHLKLTAHPSLREKIKAFYKDLLQCEVMQSPYPDMDLYHFSNDVVLGVHFSNDALSEKDALQSAWLEIKSDKAPQIKEALIKFGVKPVDYSDKTNFYFQAPGGQVYRLVMA